LTNELTSAIIHLMNRIPILLLIATTLFSAPVFLCCETLQTEKVIIEANTIEVAPPVVHAFGRVSMMLGNKQLTADEVIYNRDKNTGEMTDASFTTCELENPHYHVSARTIHLTENGDIAAEHVGIYFGSKRLLTLPKLRTKLQGSRDQSYIPRPGYSSRDGLFINLAYAIAQNSRTDLNLIVRPTTKHGLEAGLAGGYAISGSGAGINLYSQETDLDIRNRMMPASKILRGFEDNTDETSPHRVFAFFGGLMLNERVFDVNYPSLTATRLPEIGLRLTNPGFHPTEIDPKQTIPISIDLRTSWGRFDDSVTDHYVNRIDARGVIGIRLTPKQSDTSLRLLLMGRHSHYEGSYNYGVVGGAFEIAHSFGKGCFASTRIIDQKISGTTPFEFDNVDVRRELQNTLRIEKGLSTWAGIVRYDLDDKRIRDWELAYARRIHCIEPGIVWRNRFSEISFVLRIPGL